MKKVSATFLCEIPDTHNIQEVYSTYVASCIIISAFTILLYSIVLKLPQEIKYIWSKPYSLPVFLYICTKYGIFIIQGLLLLVVLRVITRLCTIPYGIAGFVYILFTIGAQGLLIARTYAVGRGNKLLMAILIIGCFVAMITSILNYSTVAGPLGTLGPKLLSEITDASFIFTDLVAFCTSTNDIWNTWKLKREAGLQSSNNITTVLLRQNIFRCISAVTFAAASAISNQIFEPVVTHSIECFGISVVAILIADFILDIRQCNYASIEASTTGLPVSTRFQDVLQHMHQSIIVELGPTVCDLEEESGKDDGIYEESEFATCAQKPIDLGPALGV